VSHLTKSFLRADANYTRMRSFLEHPSSQNHDNAKALSTSIASKQALLACCHHDPELE
jgi:hypothetical protein